MLVKALAHDDATHAANDKLQLGWSDVAIIDDDLGRSGGGVARPGFEKSPAAICDGRVVVALRRLRSRRRAAAMCSIIVTARRTMSCLTPIQQVGSPARARSTEAQKQWRMIQVRMRRFPQ
jgi:hypothetical protein